MRQLFVMVHAKKQKRLCMQGCDARARRFRFRIIAATDCNDAKNTRQIEDVARFDGYRADPIPLSPSTTHNKKRRKKINTENLGREERVLPERLPGISVA